MNDGSTDLKFKLQRYKKLFTVRLNIRVINDIRTAMKTFTDERQYSIRYRVLDRATNWKPNNTGHVRCNSSKFCTFLRLFVSK